MHPKQGLKSELPLVAGLYVTTSLQIRLLLTYFPSSPMDCPSFAPHDPFSTWGMKGALQDTDFWGSSNVLKLSL